MAVGFVSTIPYLVGVVVMFVWSSHSDMRTERLWHLTIAYLLTSAGLTISAFATAPVVSMLGLTVAVSGYLASVPVFWTIPSRFLASTAAAGAIAMINSIGNLGGFFGPVLVGQITKSTGSPASGLLGIAIIILSSPILILLVHKLQPRRQKLSATA
jgi:MFS transporter, ACS family, tartrate transporter